MISTGLISSHELAPFVYKLCIHYNYNTILLYTRPNNGRHSSHKQSYHDYLGSFSPAYNTQYAGKILKRQLLSLLIIIVSLIDVDYDLGISKLFTINFME